MRRFLVIFLLALLAVSCRRAPEDVQGGPYLNLYLECPSDAVPDTKADEGEVPSASAAEYVLHDIQIWIFKSSNHEAVKYITLSGAQLPVGGRVRKYSIPVERAFASARPDVDVFVLANAASVGCTLGENDDYDSVKDAVFGDGWFGVQTPVRSVDPSLGLPMTGTGLNLPIQGEDPVLKIEAIRITRAVSKVRYVFCRMKEEGGDSDEVSVDNIVLNGGLFPVQEYLFTTGASGIVPGNFVAEPLSVAGSSSIAQNEMPEKLVYAGQDPVSYENLLNTAVADGILTDCGVIYLRETTKALTGHVNYTINGGDQQTKTFSMDAPGDFARNHTWTLYGYFLGGRNLQLSVRALPWDYNIWSVNFSNASVQAGQLFIDDTTASIRETSKDHFDVRLIAGVTCKCHLTITAPVSGKLMIRPIGDAPSFHVTPDMIDIDPTRDNGRVDIEIRRNPDAEDVAGHCITLSFSVELGERFIEADTEILNGEVYRFIL